MKAILFLVLSAIILSQSYGFAYAVHVSGHLGGGVDLNDEFVITIETDSSSYKTGDIVHVYGSVSDYNEEDPYKNFDVALRVIASNNNIISISQIPLDGGGSYSTSILAGGPLWKFDGDYTISASHGSDRSVSVTFAFVNSESEEVTTEVEAEVAAAAEAVAVEVAAEKCGEGTHLEDGVCMLDESSESETVSANTGSVPTEGFNSWIYSITFTLLIAFVIAISLFLISRVRGKKTV